MTNATETERPSPKVIDAKTFWRTLGERAIGATIVTAHGADGPAGFLGLSATHVCADPPSMLVSIDRKTSALAAVLHGHQRRPSSGAAKSNSGVPVAGPLASH
jgi:flavin reductase (DIM6/NTAB) family NADH-FMN oxidoreductase RutF